MDSVSVFLEIVKNGSISRTADLLGYSQSNLSHMLSVLEKELDTTLLIRSRSGVRLTAEGEMLLPYLNDIAHANERLDEKVQAMHGLTMGKVRVGLGVSILSALAVEGLDDSLLVKKLNEKESRKIGLAATAKPSSAAKKFIQFVLQWVAEKYS